MKFGTVLQPHPSNFAGSPPHERGRQTREGWKASHFLALNANISKMVEKVQSYYQ